MANRVAGSRKYCVLPKIHSHRSVIKLATALRIRKKTRQKCVGLQVSIDHNFEGVVAGCIKQHGHSWLYPPLIFALREMHTKGPITPMGHSGTDGAKVKVHSVEVVDKQGRLVAGIIPYHIIIVIMIMIIIIVIIITWFFFCRRTGLQRRHVLHIHVRLLGRKSRRHSADMRARRASPCSRHAILGFRDAHGVQGTFGRDRRAQTAFPHHPPRCAGRQAVLPLHRPSTCSRSPPAYLEAQRPRSPRHN
jgi:hypothetical protein